MPSGEHACALTTPLAFMTAFTPAAVARASALPNRLMGLPFDAMRAQYANAVRAGWIERSMLASSQFDHAVSVLERLTCGPFARKV
jgi:hypothetical protein